MNDMVDVILLTLFIVLVTFVIGFLVAWLISLIVPITDVADFYEEHQHSLKRLKRIERARSKRKKAKGKGGVELMDYYYEVHPDAVSDDLIEEMHQTKRKGFKNLLASKPEGKKAKNSL